MSTTLFRRHACAVLGAWLLAAPPSLAGAQSADDPSASPRLVSSGLPPHPARVVSGGEVVLELAIDASGAVTNVEPLRATPPFTEVLASAAAGWRFEPAVSIVDGERLRAPGRVLVAAVFRPPALYAGGTAGTPPETVGIGSPDIPRPLALTPPLYPPNALGNGMVLVEIEMTTLAEPLEYRVVTATPGFEDVALAAVRSWRFSPPGAPDAPDRLYVYALLAFREPLAPVRANR